MHRRERQGRGIGSTLSGPLGVVRRIAFWLAVVLPVAYGPLLYGSLDERTSLVLVGLLCVNFACLVLGHDYAR